MTVWKLDLSSAASVAFDVDCANGQVGSAVTCATVLVATHGTTW